MNGFEHVELSAAGRARRDELRDLLGRVVVRRRRTRKAVRGTIALGLIASIAWIAWPGSDRAATPPVDERIAESSPAFRYIEIVTDRDDVLARYAIRVEVDSSVFLRSDDELLEQLEHAGHPTGLLRIGETVT
ncbi:MAG: hypothetical protein KDB80_11895, partial [Planctomycetes bacterium]|nr:hypothetical protein [Planctomycetota bacterium]